jgi:hypothetical protein
MSPCRRFRQQLAGIADRHVLELPAADGAPDSIAETSMKVPASRGVEPWVAVMSMRTVAGWAARNWVRVVMGSGPVVLVEPAAPPHLPAGIFSPYCVPVISMAGSGTS